MRNRKQSLEVNNNKKKKETLGFTIMPTENTDRKKMQNLEV